MNRRSMRIASTFATVFAFVITLGLAGCSDDDDDNPVNPGTPATQFTGVMTAANDGGLVTLSIPLASGDLSAARPAGSVAAHDVVAVATLALDAGGTVNLSGTYSEETDSLHLSGQGYTMNGRYDPAEPVPGIAGEVLGPVQGVFDCAIGGTATVRAWCGEQTRNLLVYEPMHAGIVDFADLFGFIVIDGQTIHFEGTATGNGGVYSLTARKDLGGGAELLIDGTLSTGIETMWGEWLIEVNGVQDDSGTWSLGPCLPGTTGSN